MLLPVGAVEPHGPHAPLGTDSYISQAVCERAAAALAEDADVRAYVLPTVGYGVTRYGAAFPGALSLSAQTLQSLVGEIVESVREQGFPHPVVVNNHFEPEHVAALRHAAAASHAPL